MLRSPRTMAPLSKKGLYFRFPYPEKRTRGTRAQKLTLVICGGPWSTWSAVCSRVPRGLLFTALAKYKWEVYGILHSH